MLHTTPLLLLSDNRASLVQELPISAFRSVDDLITCRVKARDVCIPRGGAVMDFWRSAILVSYVHLK